MFSDDYKREIENVKPDGYIKQKVLKSIDEIGEKTAEKQKNKPP